MGGLAWGGIRHSPVRGVGPWYRLCRLARMTEAVVIVVNYRSGDRLRRCLATVLSQRPAPARVLVVDNASDDGSADDLPEGVQLIRRPVNDGYGPAVLAGLAASDERHVFTLNPDTELEPDALALAGAALDRDHRAGAIALRVLRAADPERLDADGIGLTSSLGAINMDHGLLAADVGDEPRTVLGPLGGAALWRRVALERAGSFSTRFFLYWEDMDVALRMVRAGYECRTAPAARVRHEGSGIVGRWSRLNVHYMLRNHWPCLLGALPGRVLVRRLPALLVAPVRAAALYALRGRPFVALAGLAAGALRSPGALLGRRDLIRTGSGAHMASALEQLMADADASRERMRAAGLRGARLGDGSRAA